MEGCEIDPVDEFDEVEEETEELEVPRNKDRELPLE